MLASYTFNPINDKDATAESSLNLGPVWGLKRVYKSSFFFDVNMGLGYNEKNKTRNTIASDTSGNLTYYPETGHYSGINFMGALHLGFYIGKK